MRTLPIAKAVLPRRSVPLRARLVGTLALSLLALAACSTPTARKGGPVIRGDVSAVTLDPPAVRDMLSQYRRASGLQAVRLDPALNAMAQVQADAMAAEGVLSHDAAGPFAARLKQAGIGTTNAGENVAAGYFSQESAFQSWRNSPAHDKNLLMPQATRFGIALAKAPGTRYKTYWAMVVAAEPPPPPIMAEAPMRRRVVQTGTVGEGLVDAVKAPFSTLFSP